MFFIARVISKKVWWSLLQQGEADARTACHVLHGVDPHVVCVGGEHPPPSRRMPRGEIASGPRSRGHFCTSISRHVCTSISRHVCTSISRRVCTSISRRVCTSCRNRRLSLDAFSCKQSTTTAKLARAEGPRSASTPSNPSSTRCRKLRARSVTTASHQQKSWRNTI